MLSANLLAKEETILTNTLTCLHRRIGFSSLGILSNYWGNFVDRSLRSKLPLLCASFFVLGLLFILEFPSEGVWLAHLLEVKLRQLLDEDITVGGVYFLCILLIVYYFIE
jgi:hypothetical protein